MPATPTEEEARKPFLYRFFEKIPEAGKFTLLDSGWMNQIMEEKLSGALDDKTYAQRVDSVKRFERTLTDNGYLVLKFFFHISKKEQASRIQRLQADKDTAWRVSKGDLWQNHHYDDCLEAFDRYLDTDEYQRIERWKAGAPECIAAIHDAGGKAVLAHPCQLGCSHGRLEEILRALKDAGLDGIECFYPRHSPEQTAAYLRLADKYGLHITGGSDFHGEAVRPDTFLTPIPLNLDWLGTFQNAQPHRNRLDQSQIPHFR